MNIYESITKIMSELGAISKDKVNSQQGFKYRGIDDVMNALNPLLAKHKVFVVPEVIEHKREERTSSKGNVLLYSICTIKYTFYAEDGTSVFAVVIGEGMDSGDKATNKAMAIAMKYACFQTFCIPTGDDPDSETYELQSTKISAVKPPESNIICDDCGASISSNIALFCQKNETRFKGKIVCPKCQKNYDTKTKA